MISKSKEKNIMPKMKSHSGAAKRFKVTGTGKVKYNKSNRSKLLTNKPTGRKRKARNAHYIGSAKQAKTIKNAI